MEVITITIKAKIALAEAITINIMIISACYLDNQRESVF